MSWLRQLMWRRAKILHGLYRTRVSGWTAPCDPAEWFDAAHYAQGTSDRRTIAADKSPVVAHYHYASVETLILRHLVNADLVLEGARVFDVGSGAGHWLRFYRGLGAARCHGIDVSAAAVRHVARELAADGAIAVHEGAFQDHLERCEERYDVVNAIGVLFHVVDDAQWQRGLAAIARVLAPGGMLLVGGYFGWLDGVNVQFDERHRVTKRLRSARRWRRELAAVGLRDVRIHRNTAYLWIGESLPENHVLAARR